MNDAAKTTDEKKPVDELKQNCTQEEDENARRRRIEDRLHLLYRKNEDIHRKITPEDAYKKIAT